MQELFLYVTKVLLMTTLSVFAMLARILMCAIPTHWACVGLAYLLDGDPDQAVAISGPISVLVLLAGLAGAAVAWRRPEGRARMAMGPGMISQWRPLVLTIGVGSALGGLALFAFGSASASYLAIGLGGAVVVFETLAIVGTPPDGSLQYVEVETTPQPIQLPRWALPLAYWLTIGPFIAMAGSRVAAVPVALLLILFKASERTLEIVYWPLQIVGYAVGIGLAWIVWRQIAGYLSKNAA